MAYRISMRNRYSTSADNYRRFTTETTAPDASSESPSPHRIPSACLRSLTSIGQQQPSQQETWAPAANASFDQYIYDDCCGSMKSKQDSTDRLVSRIELVWMPHAAMHGAHCASIQPGSAAASALAIVPRTVELER